MPTNPIKILRTFTLVCLAIASLFVYYIGYLHAFTIQNEAGGEEEFEGEIEELHLNLTTRRQEIEKLKQQAEEYRRKLLAERNEALSLKNQLTILDTEIAKVKIEIKTKEQEIELTNLDIQDTEETITALQEKITIEKEIISEILRRMDQNDGKSYLEILLMNDSLSDFFNEAEYITSLHEGLQRQLETLKDVTEKRENERVQLEEKKDALIKHKAILDEERAKLEVQEQVKSQLLEETQAKESKFRGFLTDLKDEQEDINSEIVSLEKDLREKIELQEEAEKLKLSGGERFIWPVPKNVITAFFHDPDYPYRYVFEHPAVDIRAPQRTGVRAAGAGYIAKAKKDTNCRNRYAYVMIIHANGLSTVYGHLNRIDVEEGQFVRQGDLIGLSGGMPGTCGAGRLTTGPHLHFEVRLNGIPVDPLEYL